MHPLVRGAAAAAVFTALGSFDRGAPDLAPSAAPHAEAHGIDGMASPCGPSTLPEGPVCVRIPGDDEALHERPLVAAPSSTAPARSSLGSERIPRRPERAADPAAYVYPVGDTSRAPRVQGGIDAEMPGVRIAARPGEEVVLVALEHQSGPAEVVFTGDLFGRTVATAHTVEEGTRKRTFVVLHGGIDRIAPDVVPHAKLDPHAVLGFARAHGDAPGAVSLIEIYVEAREVRDGASLTDVDGKRLVDAAFSVPIDVRNVLPLRAR